MNIKIKYTRTTKAQFITNVKLKNNNKMSRNRDNAPIGHTCPAIDRVISFLNKIDWNIEDEVERDLSIDCKDAIIDMEEIRKANDTLRTWGNEECKYKEEYEKEVENLKYDLSVLTNEITELKICN